MKTTNTNIEGCIVITPTVFTDERGYFVETFNQQKYSKILPDTTFVQDNESRSQYGVIRGLHYQIGEYCQAKLVRVIQGKVLDVVVDLRKNSPSFGKHFSIKLSEENHKQLFVPRGCAHGFAVLSDIATFSYKCDNFYNPQQEAGVIYNDPELAIDWKIPADKHICSKKDLLWPRFETAKHF